MQTEKRGHLAIAHTDKGYVVYQTPVYAQVESVSDDGVLDMQTGETEIAPLSAVTGLPLPEFFHAPNADFAPLPLGKEAPALTLLYRDHLQKQVPLATSYEVQVIFLYIEKHPKIEALTGDDLRNFNARNPDTTFGSVAELKQYYYDRAVSRAVS